MTAEERIAQIAAGFGQGIQNYQAGQQRQQQQSLQEEALRRQQALQSIEAANQLGAQSGRMIDPAQVQPLLASGNLQGLGELLQAAPQSDKALREQREAERLARKMQLDEMQTIANINNLNRKNRPETSPEGKAMRQKVAEARIADFDIASPDIVPSTQDAEKVKTLNTATKTFVDVGNRAIKRLGTFGKLDRTGFTDNAKNLTQDITEMRLQAKELANLGVLNGPDLSLVDQALGAAQSDILIYGPDSAKERIAGALETANSKLRNAATARGYAPRNLPKIDYKKPNQAPLSVPGLVDEAVAADPEYQEYLMLMQKAGR